ncbi:hypothetical protein Pmani_022387 [Petrolisthes manimaculis]|uniref:Uncharacterized protein n=1 Tax=Petrolisthes manimaculis TaxID=1843537 RepID=A0AAE1PC77_9EUCA|nr:hypothetical protein Pmani_022387 [Petrolisthes manimaculis]
MLKSAKPLHMKRKPPDHQQPFQDAVTGKSPLMTSVKSGTAPPKSRRKINTHGEIVTQKQCIEQMKVTEVQQKEKKLSKTKKKEKQPRKKIKRTKQPEPDLYSTTSTEDELSFVNSSDDLSLGLDSYEDPEEDAEHMKSPTPDAKSPKPKLSEESIGKYFAVYYTEPLTYYWGKVTKVLYEDEDGEVTRVEVDFLKKETIASNPSFYKCTMYFPDEAVYTCLGKKKL